MLVRVNNFIAIAVTALAFGFCGWLIAGDTGAAISAALALAMFLRPATLRSPMRRGGSSELHIAGRQRLPRYPDLA